MSPDSSFYPAEKSTISARSNFGERHLRTRINIDFFVPLSFGLRLQNRLQLMSNLMAGKMQLHATAILAEHNRCKHQTLTKRLSNRDQ